MTYIWHCFRRFLSSYVISLFLCCLLDRWSVSVHAAVGGSPSSDSYEYGDATVSGETSSLPASTRIKPSNPCRAQGRLVKRRTGASWEGPSWLEQAWCSGRAWPLSQLRDMELPLPSFVQVLHPHCQTWMTARDRKGRSAVLREARITLSRASRAPHPRSPSSLLEMTVPAGEEFRLAIYALAGGVRIDNPHFRRGHIISDGSWGVVAAAMHLPELSSSQPSAAAPSATDDVSSGAAMQQPLSLAQRFRKRFSRIRQSFMPRCIRSSRRSSTPTGGVVEDKTDESLPSGPTHAPSGSASASGPQLLTGDREQGASGLLSEKGSSSTASGDTWSSSAASGHSRSPRRVVSDNEKFLKTLKSDMEKGRNLDNIFVLKVAVTSDSTFPTEPNACTEAATAIILDRIARAQETMKWLPQGYTADDLCSFGFVLPIAQGQFEDMDLHVSSSRYSSWHLLNYVQVLRPQLSDVYSLSIYDENAHVYITKRLIQLAAHLQAAGIVHLDIKRENIAVSPAGELMLLDFDYVRSEGDQFPCNNKPTIEYAAPEISRGTLKFLKTKRPQQCVAKRSVDLWDMGITLFELVCDSSEYFPCSNPSFPHAYNIECIASLQPETMPIPGLTLSTSRAPVKWGPCKPPLVVMEIIYGLLDLEPEKRLDALKTFVYSTLFRNAEHGTFKYTMAS